MDTAENAMSHEILERIVLRLMAGHTSDDVAGELDEDEGDFVVSIP